MAENAQSSAVCVFYEPRMPNHKICVICQIKLRSLQSIRLSTSTDIGCAFGPRKASKVEKPSSRGVSSLHRWSLILLQFSGPCPCALSAHTCVCIYYSDSTQLSVVATLAPSPELGPMTQTDLSASMWLHINIAKQTNK